jgi:hypothetical protein
MVVNRLHDTLHPSHLEEPSDIKIQRINQNQQFRLYDVLLLQGRLLFYLCLRGAIWLLKGRLPRIDVGKPSELKWL